MSYLFYILGLAPSLVWLAFYLRKDKHPESNWMVLTTFVFGMAVSLLALIAELTFESLRPILSSQAAAIAKSNVWLGEAWVAQYGGAVSLLVAIFIGGALIEEYAKYKVARAWMFNSSDVDEPIDIMLFLIIAALGFAAMENIMVLHNQSFQAILTASDALATIGWRFISATFLHALCSGVVGFSLAWSIHKGKHGYRYVATGLLTAVILHGIYNWAIMEGGTRTKIIAPATILLLLAAVVGYGFQKLKSLKSTCLIKTS